MIDRLTRHTDPAQALNQALETETISFTAQGLAIRATGQSGCDVTELQAREFINGRRDVKHIGSGIWRKTS